MELAANHSSLTPTDVLLHSSDIFTAVYLLLCLLAKYVQLNVGLLWEAKVSVGWTEVLLLVLVITLPGPTAPRWFCNCPLNDSHASERKTESPSLPFTAECLISV